MQQVMQEIQVMQMFSVVIPAYNCEATISRVLDSVKNQTKYNLIKEIIIINDGSTDCTDQTIKSYMKQNPDMNIIYEVQQNHGVSYTRNRGIRMAKAEWIALLDADDLWKENKLERQSEIIWKNPQILFLGAVYPLKFWFKKIYGLYKVSAKELCVRNTPTPSSVVFKRTVGIELGLFDENMSYSEDINFFQKFLLKDSYYMLAEDLVVMGFAKKYYAQSGLSSHLYEMHLGRNRNTREMYQMQLISWPYMVFMLMLGWIKYFRRQLEHYWYFLRWEKNDRNSNT